MTRKTSKCPNCGADNFFDEDAGRIIDCISCCYDETIPATYEYDTDAEGNVVNSRIAREPQIIKRGCTFEVDDKGKVVRIVRNG